MVWAGTSGRVPGIALGMALSEAVLFLALLVPGLKLVNTDRPILIAK
jgi:hypothetical protein